MNTYVEVLIICDIKLFQKYWISKEKKGKVNQVFKKVKNTLFVWESQWTININFSELDQVKKDQGLVSQSQNILLCSFRRKYFFPWTTRYYSEYLILYRQFYFSSVTLYNYMNFDFFFQKNITDFDKLTPKISKANSVLQLAVQILLCYE